MQTQRRRLFWHGFLFLFIAFSLGMLTAANVPPSGGRWMIAHVGTMIGAVVVLVCAAAWSELRLSEGQRKWAFRLLLGGSYAGTALNILGTALQVPGPATQPGVLPQGMQAAVLVTCLPIVIIGFFGSAGLFLYGMRGDASK